jgi:hypothetical protein
VQISETVDGLRGGVSCVGASCTGADVAAAKTAIARKIVILPFCETREKTDLRPMKTPRSAMFSGYCGFVTGR